MQPDKKHVFALELLELKIKLKIVDLSSTYYINMLLATNIHGV